MKRLHLLLFMGATAACAGPRALTPPPPPDFTAPGAPDPGGADLGSASAAVLAATSDGRTDQPHFGHMTGAGALSLSQALTLALRDRADLAQARARVHAAAARARAAGRGANPELTAGLESVPFDSNALGGAEVLFGISQSIPLTGHLVEARAAGLLERDALGHAARARLLEVRREVHGAFATALFAQEMLDLHDGLLSVSGQLLDLVRGRHAIGDAVRTDVQRAELARAEVARERRRAASLRTTAFLELAAATGNAARPVDAVAGDLVTTLELPALEELLQRLERHPALLAARAGADASAARLDAAELRRIPDLRLSLLYRRDQPTRDEAFDVILGMPLPLFDTGRDRRDALRHDLLGARAAERSVRTTREAALSRAHQETSRAMDELTFQRDEVLPLATEVAAMTRARHALGDASLDQVLAAEQGLSRTRLDLAAARGDVHRAWAALLPYLD